MRKLIVGLGNPGKEYEKTPHNVGFSLLIDFAQALGLGSPSKKWKSLAWSTQYSEDVELHLMMPQTYMNLSGDAVRKCVKDKQVTAENILVIHDEVDFVTGEFKFKNGGGMAGHNGLKSITVALSTQEYARLRVGVGPFLGGNLSDFVLKRFSKSDNDVILSRSSLIQDSFRVWIEQGIVEAMNQFNMKEK